MFYGIIFLLIELLKYILNNFVYQEYYFIKTFDVFELPRLYKYIFGNYNSYSLTDSLQNKNYKLY